MRQVMARTPAPRSAPAPQMATKVDARVTLSEVADRAGVSLAAASLALRGKPGVADDTRTRIASIAAELGYRLRSSDRPNDASTDGDRIGILLKARPDELGASDAFYGPIISGVSEACAAMGHEVRIDTMQVDHHYNPIEVPRLITQRGADGLIVLGAFLPRSTADLLADWPVVLVDGYAEEPDRFPSVVSDNIGGIRAATRALVDLGHRRILFAGSTPDAYPSIRERRHGFELAMLEAGLEAHFVDGHHAEPDEVAPRAVAYVRRHRITAVVGANDPVALAVMAELGAAGIDVPSQVSVVGFDDLEAATLVRPRLDTVAIDKPAMGRLAASLLVHRMIYPADRPFTSVQHARLMRRESTGPAVTTR